jgi:hypothetical protein
MQNIKEYRRVIFESLEYKPTPEQLLVHDDESRLKLVTGGEGSGKSMLTAMEGFLDIPRVKLIWIAGNEYADCRKEFEYLVDWMVKANIVAGKPSFPKEGECSMRALSGCEIVTKAVKDPVKIGAESPDLILVCEAARIDYLAYLRLRGRIARNRGRMVLSGTLEDSLSWYPEFALRWGAANPEGAKSFSMPTYANTYKYPRDGVKVVLKDGTVIENTCDEIEKLAAETPLDLFKERYMGVVCKPSNLVIPDFTNNIHVDENVKFNPELNVEIAVDPGYGGAYAVLAIQKFEDRIHVIDEVYLGGYVTEEIIDICKDKEWWKKVTGGVIDIAGKQHQAMKAPVEVWTDKAKVYLRSKKVAEEQGIDLLRTKLHVNPIKGHATIYFNPNCAGFFSECGGGKSPIPGAGAWTRDKNLGRPIDKYNHSAKALIYYLVDILGYTEKQGESVWGKIFRDTPDRRMEPVRR